MENYYLFANGELKRKDNNISIITEDKGTKDLKIEVMNDIYLFGEISTNTKCINYLGQMKVPVHFFNYYGFYTGSFYPKETNVSGNLLIKQVEYYTDNEKRSEIAKEFIESAAFNIYRNLRYYNGRGKDLENVMGQIKGLQKELSKAENINEIMGVEGNIRKVYYSAWKEIINQEIDFEKRVKRPPDNMINTLISFVNSLIYTTCLSEIYKTQLNPTISYLHSAGERRFSLCLDVAEIFKPLIGDRLIFSLLNKNMITEKDFEKGSNFYYLKENGRKKILKEYDERLKQTIKHKDLGREVSYSYLIRLECYKLIKHILGDKKYEGFKMWW
ncbi:MAG: type I-B CRISPR-associated endonuclease Cas1b [Fusobacterium sp.]|nr:type I-B CRISPR-associated endonuclease Cas1 [Fusobacterium sp.]